MIKCGEAAVQMILRSGRCNNRDKVVNEIQFILDLFLARELSEVQIAEIIEKNSFKDDEMEAICEYTGYTLAYIPKSFMQNIPIG